MTTQELPAVFKARVNLVLVPVVVRDAKGRTVGGYTQNDFQLFDKGKPQVITKFSLEKGSDQGAKTANTAGIVRGEPGALEPDIAERFVAYLFDDLHLANT